MALTEASPGSPGQGGGPSGLWSGIYGLGMALVFVGERIVGTGKPRAVVSIVGVGLLLIAMLARAVRGGRAAPDRRAAERYIQSMYALGLLAVALYFVQSDVPALRGGKALEATWPKLATVLGAIWPAAWCAAAFAVLAMELAYAPMSRAPRVELGRVRAAQFSGLGLAFMLAFAFSLSYAASERDKKVDLAYFRTTRPGESTRKIVRGLDQPLTVAIFFPNGNEVREEVDGYFGDLGKESGQLKIEHYDHDIDPVKAKELGVSANAIVVFVRGGRKEQLGLQLQLESARSALKTLDREVQQRLLSVVKPNRVTLLTQGHGERTSDPTGDTDRRPGVKELRNALLDQGHDVRDLGPAEGLATDVPEGRHPGDGARPDEAFHARGDGGPATILGPGGTAVPGSRPRRRRGHARAARTDRRQADDEDPGQRSGLRAPDPPGQRSRQSGDGLYSSHPSVSTLSRQGMHAPIILPGATAIEGPHGHATANKDYAVDFTVHAHFSTFADTNGNFQPDPGEERKAWELAAAISKKKDKTEQRLFVVGDSDFLTDPVIRFGGNGLLVLDPVRWLMGEESFAGQISTEADVPISHTRKQDVAWFYSSIFAVPGLVLGLGAIVTRRRRRGRRKTSGATATAQTPTSATGPSIPPGVGSASSGSKGAAS